MGRFIAGRRRGADHDGVEDFAGKLESVSGKKMDLPLHFAARIVRALQYFLHRSGIEVEAPVGDSGIRMEGRVAGKRVLLRRSVPCSVATELDQQIYSFGAQCVEE